MSDTTTITPEKMAMVRKQDARFWRQVNVSGSCWIWTGIIDHKGYGQFAANHKKHLAAHRWAYEALVGPIKEGLVVDHLCRNRACCNPDHMELVTTKENVLRGEGITAQNARRVACCCGHEYSVCHRKNGRSYRFCKRCKNEHQREKRREKRIEEAARRAVAESEVKG